MRAWVFAFSAIAAFAATPVVADEAKPAAEKPEFSFTVIEENARIPFGASRIRGFRVVDDDSVLFDAGRRWYRAELFGVCASDLRFEHALAFRTRGDGAIDRGTTLFVRGQRCPILKLDEIADPDAAPPATVG